MKLILKKFRKVLILGAMMLSFLHYNNVEAQTPCVGTNALNNNEPLNITIMNAVGGVMTERVVGGGFGETQFNLGDFGNGMYFILMTNKGQTIIKKVIVKD